MQTTQIDLSQLTHEDLMNLRRHLRGLLILVEQLLRLSLTPARESDKG